MNRIQQLAFRTKKFLHRAFNIREGRAPYRVIHRRFVNGARLTGTHLCILIVAMLIACIGLDTDSDIAIVGAMLICPLMGSVLAISYGVATLDRGITAEAIAGLALQMAFCLVTSTIYFKISPIASTTPALVDNSTPTVWDLALALAGTFLVATGGNPGQLDLPVMGLVWGLVCALSSACLSVLPAKPMARWGNFTVNGIAFLVSGSVLAAVYRPWEHMPALDVTAVAALVFIVLIGTFGSYALFLQGVHDAGSMRASLLGTSEPIAATISTVLLLGTALSPADLLGFAFILAMVYLTA